VTIRKAALRRLLRAQEGITLVMAVGILGCFTLTGATLMYYASTTSRSAAYSGQNNGAYDLAEAGVNEMMAVLSQPSNNALNKYLLGLQPNGTVMKTTHAYAGGTVTWWGILNEGTATWSLTSVGETKDPTGPTASPIRRTLTAKVPVTPTLTQPLNSPAWNYIYATQTGNTCDMTISQSVQVGSPLYVNGNLCLQNTAAITNGPLVARGRLTLVQSANAVGSSTAPINEAHIAGGCQWKNNPFHSACSSLDNVFARTLDSTPTQIAAPAVDWDGWYRNASPGPYFPCYAQSGTIPVFDNDQGARRPRPDPTQLQRARLLQPDAGGLLHVPDRRRRALLGCGRAHAQDPRNRFHRRQRTGAERSREHLSGARLALPFGHASGQELEALRPSGFGRHRLRLCRLGPQRDHARRRRQRPRWRPGTGRRFDPARLGQLSGSPLRDECRRLDTTSQAIGPMVGSTVYLGQSTATSFPSVTVAPAGMPGSPLVYAQPNPPQLYGG
jgi:hypothetical protein